MTKSSTDHSPEAHGKKLAQDSKDGVENLKKMGGELVEVEFLKEAVYDDETHEPGSVCEMPEVDARYLVQMEIAKYNATTFTANKKPNTKKVKATVGSKKAKTGSDEDDE